MKSNGMLSKKDSLSNEEPSTKETLVKLISSTFIPERFDNDKSLKTKIVAGGHHFSKLFGK